MPSRRLRTLALSVATLGATLALAATAVAAAPPAAPSPPTAAELARLAACLRAHGVKDVAALGRGRRPPRGGRPRLSSSQQAARRKAFAACRSLAPRGGFGFAARRNSPQLAAYRACMAKHGVRFSEPGSTQRPRYTAKAFQAATKACGHLLAGSGPRTRSG